jgi:hypothetical protein
MGFFEFYKENKHCGYDVYSDSDLNCLLQKQGMQNAIPVTELKMLEFLYNVRDHGEMDGAKRTSQKPCRNTYK